MRFNFFLFFFSAQLFVTFFALNIAKGKNGADGKDGIAGMPGQQVNRKFPF